MAKNKKTKLKKIIKTIIYILFITFLSWGLYIIGRLIVKPTNIFIVNNGEVYKSETALSYIIRDEEIIQSDENKEIMQIKTEGEKVAKGDVVFRYHTSDEDDINKQIQDLNIKIQEALEGQTDLFSGDIKALEGQIESKIEGINRKNNIQNIKEYKNDISTYITKKAKIAGELSTSETYIKSLIEEKEGLERDLNQKAEHIYAPKSGIVSYRIDNLEETFNNTEDFSYINSKFLKDLNIKPGQIIGTSNNKAKIVNNYKCYIATVLKSEEAQNAKLNKNIKIKISNNTIDAKIKYKKTESKNKTIIVFEINDDVDKLTELRKASIDVIWWEVKGLKIPKDAIYYDNGLAYVTRNRAGYTEKILVKILEENGDYCIIDNYDTDEMQKIDLKIDDIKLYKKINLFDEIVLNPNK